MTDAQDTAQVDLGFWQSFQHINQTAPHLAPYREIHAAFAKSYQGGHLSAWLNEYFSSNGIVPYLHGTNTPLQFTAQDDLPHGTAYEAYIHQTAKIPTRDNLHDWFGACVWSVFAKSKALLNAKHIAYDDDQNSGNGRSRVRDTITVFDENGAIVVVSQDTIGAQIGSALAAFDWQNCLVKTRQYWDHLASKDTHAKVFVFGHALLEQLISPYKSLCAHTLILHVPQAFFGLSQLEQLKYIDEMLCEQLNDFLVAGVTPRQLHPLPILGVPYFWDNADPDFYQDAFVFRTGRKNSKR
ncbi:DUF3025 domain-containing protein [Moraxella canis]|uniref:DUF3025 domain-containing protein n=1 Tax=Moraxella canis TaxID=90239 RepID=A0A1S9ZJY3_9GAMM|nr:DUF3025 domain-containing protein [Moraxella canis]OOR83879.1 hypothetical protein B0180_05380 [Moraxella canis]